VEKVKEARASSRVRFRKLRSRPMVYDHSVFFFDLLHFVQMRRSEIFVEGE